MIPFQPASLILSILILSPILVADASPISCCMPNQIGGMIYNLQSQETTHFYLDFEEGLYFSTYIPYGPDFNVTDFRNGVTYIVTEGNPCQTEPYTYTVKLQQCLRGVPEPYDIVDEENGFRVEMFSQQEKDLQIFKGMTRRDDVCYPFLIHQAEGGVPITELYSEIINRARKRPDFLFNQLEECKAQLEE